jgi:RHS repeat-associated protein
VQTNGAAEEATVYTYDDIDRLATVTYAPDGAHPNGRKVTYGHDGAGNRKTEVVTDPQTEAVLESKTGHFDNANRLTELTDNLDSVQTTTLVWDKNGNLLSETKVGVTTSYRYDLRDTLAEVERGGQPLARLLGDFDERRVLKIGDPTRPGGSGVQEYLYNGSRLVLDVENGQPTARYEWTNEELVSLLQSGGTRRYFALDGLETVLALTDEAGLATDRLNFDAWGVPTPGTDFGTSGNRFAFTSHRFDTELDLYYAGGRMYSPTIGRFISQDTLSLDPNNPDTWDLFSYARGNPTRYVDPTGHQTADPSAPRDEADETAGRDTRPASPPSEQLSARELQPWEPGWGAQATVVQEETWLDKVRRKLGVVGRTGSAMWDDFWSWAGGHAGDQGEALAKGTIKQRPPSESTRTKQEIAQALADRDPTLVAQAQQTAQQADLAEAARQQAGEFGRAGGEGGVWLAREGVGAYGQVKAIQLATTLGASAVGAAVLGKGREALDVRRRIGIGGRIESAFAKLERQHIGAGTGTTAASRSAVRAAGNASDDAGHLIGRLLGGRGGTGYVVPQNPTVNRGTFRAFEAQVAQEVEAGREVYVRVTPRYVGNVTRPQEIVYQVRVDGQTRTVVFANP